MHVEYDKIIYNFISKIDKRFLFCFFGTLIFGFLAHIHIFTNVIFMHDSINNMFSMGVGIQLGRWALGIIWAIYKLIFGKIVVAAPFYNGLMTIVLATIAFYVIIDIVNIKSIVASFILSALMITLPVFTSLFMFIYTAPVYTFGFLLSTLAIKCLITFKNKGILVSALLIATSLGIYQALLSVSLTLIVFYCICTLINNDKTSVSSVLFFLCRSIITLFIAAILYIVILKVLLHIFGYELSGYRGINSMGMDTWQNYLYKISKAYLLFLFPSKVDNSVYTMFLYGPLRILHYILILIIITYLIILSFGKLNIYNKIMQFVAILIYPLAMKSICVFATKNETFSYTFMLYAVVLYIPFMFLLIDELIKRFKIYKYIYIILTSLFLFTSLIFVRYDNSLYIKADFAKQRLINYYNQLVTTIKNTDGYKDEYKVCYINEGEKQDNNYTNINVFDKIAGPGIDYLNGYSWRVFVNYYCGYNPSVVSLQDTKLNVDFNNIPHYPDDGAIFIKNQIVYVNF